MTLLKVMIVAQAKPRPYRLKIVIERKEARRGKERGERVEIHLIAALKWKKEEYRRHTVRTREERDGGVGRTEKSGKTHAFKEKEIKWKLRTTLVISRIDGTCNFDQFCHILWAFDGCVRNSIGDNRGEQTEEYMLR